MPGLAFQEQLEELAAETHGRSLAMPRSAEVLNLQRASIVRPTSKMVDVFYKLRSTYFSGIIELPHKFAELKALFLDPEVRDDARAASSVKEAVDKLAKLRNSLAVSSFVDRDGDNIIDVLNFLASQAAKRSSDEGRYIRRLTKKVLEAGTACEKQRERLHEIVSVQHSDLCRIVEEWEHRIINIDSRKAFDNLFEGTINDHPRITEYLAL